MRALADAVRAHVDRLDVLVNNAGGVHKARQADRGRDRGHVRGEPPRLFPPHEPAPRPRREERARARRDRGLGRPSARHPRLRGPRVRARRLLDHARLRPLQAGQRPVRGRARAPTGRHRRHLEQPASRLAWTRTSGRARPCGRSPSSRSLFRPFFISAEKGGRTDRPARGRARTSRASPGSTSRTARPSTRRRSRATQSLATAPLGRERADGRARAGLAGVREARAA